MKNELNEKLKAEIKDLKRNVQQIESVRKNIKNQQLNTNFRNSQLEGQINSYMKISESLDTEILDLNNSLQTKRVKILNAREKFCDQFDEMEEGCNWEVFSSTLNKIDKSDYSTESLEDTDIKHLRKEINELENELTILKKQVGDYNAEKAELQVIEKENAQIEMELDVWNQMNDDLIKEIETLTNEKVTAFKEDALSALMRCEKDEESELKKLRLSSN